MLITDARPLVVNSDAPAAVRVRSVLIGRGVRQRQRGPKHFHARRQGPVAIVVNDDQVGRWLLGPAAAVRAHGGFDVHQVLLDAVEPGHMGRGADEGSNHRLARRCCSGTASAATSRGWAHSTSANRWVVAVPPAAVVDRYQEHVRPLERDEHGLAANLAGHGVAQRVGMAVEDGRSAQRKSLTRRVPAKHSSAR